MAGLLDNPEALMALGSGLLSSRGTFGQALGQATPMLLQQLHVQREEQRRKQATDEQAANAAMQRQVMQQQLAQAQAMQARQQALEQRRGGYLDSVSSAAGPARGVDPAQAMQAGLSVDELQTLMPAQRKPLVVGNAVLDPMTMKPLYQAPEKPAEAPSAVREFEYGKQNPEFNAWKIGNAKAGATNIGMPKIEVKMGESVAGQIGPMAKDSRVQAQGAVGMFDSADRIQRALDSGKVSAGPLTTQIQTVKQLVQKVSGGNDDGIRQTRQVIKGLAQMSVEARKELQGQGQVTESEAAAVAKAESGDINDLTTGELQDLVTLTKRAAHMRARNHQSILDSMGSSDATRGMVPFYKIQGLDPLLKHSPQLPQIGKGNVQELADEIINRGR